VFRISFLHTRSRADAEDICQDVFISLFSAPEFSEEQQLKAWIIRVAVNKCKDFLKSKRRDRAVPLDAVSHHVGVNPLKDEYIDLIDALKKLPENDQNILYLFYYEGYSAKEIAKILDILEAAVFKRLERARDRLKGLLNYKDTD